MTSAERIREATGVDLGPVLERLDLWGLLEEGGLAVEAWLAATGSPGLYASALTAADPSVAWSFVRLLAFSRPVAAILRQNPEFASLLLEGTDEPYADDLRGGIVAEGRLLLAAANSPSHRLDRLRWLRQKWSLLVANPGHSGPEAWRMESDVADALIELAREVAWGDLRPTPEGECPVLVVGFGKLGGRELNRSSDIDLVFVLPDGLSERETKTAYRWAEAFGRAMETPMGRGTLYRVDLRLRPFGRSGDVARSARGVESYYLNYAETWEVQALLRSRPIVGPPELAARWNAMREATLRRAIWSPERIAEIVAQRERTERAADPNDLKRAAGGIRDIEWIAQIGTLIGFAGEGPETTETMLSELAARGAVTTGEATALAADYTSLRRYEDALQLRGGLQTHHWPEEPAERAAIASQLPDTPEHADRRLREIRARVAAEYDRRLRGEEPPRPSVDESAAFAYVGRFDGAEAYRSSLAENEGSAARLATALMRAPRLMAELRDAEVLEALISGEIVEERTDLHPIGGAAIRRAGERIWLRWTLVGADPRHGAIECSLLRAFGGSGLDVLVLGSVATQTFGPWSDADLLLLHGDERPHAEAEEAARRALETLRALQREGAPAAFDLRLRPEGGKGALVHSHRAFRRYADETMLPWERLALGNAVPLILAERVAGLHTMARTETTRLVESIAARAPTPEERHELFAIKDRVERERSGGESDLKLGPGGLMDVEWCVRLDEMGRGDFAPGGLTGRARRVGLHDEVALLIAARRRSDLGAIEPHPTALREARARIRARFQELREGPG